MTPLTGSDALIKSWVVGLDVYIPQPAGQYVSLLQTGDGDGELFLRDNGDGTAGIGINGQYSGAVAFDSWVRIVATVTQENGETVLRTFVNGAPVATQNLGATDRWAIDPAKGLKFFNDNDGETAAGAVSSLFYSADVPPAVQVAALVANIPAPAAGGFFATAPSVTAVEIDFAGGDIAPRYGKAKVSLDGFGYQTPAQINDSAIGFASQFGIDGPGGDVIVLDYAAYDKSEGLRVTLPGGSEDLASYSAIWDVRFDTLPGYQALLQTDVDQGNDGEFFVRGDGGLGINGDYDGTVTTKTWHRIAITVQDQGDGTSVLSKYLDGVFLDSQSVNTARFTLSAQQGFTLLSDNDGETGTGHLAHFALSKQVMDAQAIAALGGADVDGPLTENGDVTAQIGFDGYAPQSEFGFDSVTVVDKAADPAPQDNIKDLLLKDSGAPVDIDLAAAFGARATNFQVTTADGTKVDAQITGTTLTLSGQALGHSDIKVTAQDANGAPLEENFRAIVAGENAYVFAILPDTQDYTSNASIGATFGNMTDWLVGQKDALALQHVLHVGDIVQFGAAGQWELAKDAMERLDGVLSYTLGVGNHDQQRPGYSSAFSFESDIDAYFTAEQVGATAEQGGGTYDGVDVGPDTFGNGSSYANSIRNHYSTMETPDGTKWLFFSLEFGMPDDVLRWASEVVEQHADHRIMINTHSWMGGDGRINPTTQGLTTDNGGWGYAIRDNPRNVNDGEDAWREFASKYPNIMFTFSGHNFMGGAETTVSYGPSGDPVFQMFVNYQNGAVGNDPDFSGTGGDGAIRLLVIDPDNDRVTTHTKLVEKDTFYSGQPDHQEVFEDVKIGAPAQIAIAKGGDTEVVEGDGITAKVALDSSETVGDTDGARFEWFTADGEKLGETDGAPLDVSLQTGAHRLTLKVTDKNGAVSTDDKIVIVNAPAPLLTETFDDGNLDGWVTPDVQPTGLYQTGTDLGLGLPSLSGAAQIPVTLRFDSSFRPYDNQKGEVMVSYDGGASFATLLTLDADSIGGNSSLDRADETISLTTLVPNSADSIQFAFRLSEADNDWWWAIDNLVVEYQQAGQTVPTQLLAEDFDKLPLQNTVDEADPGRPVWTPTPPSGWSQDVADSTSQGATEFQGWTFMEKAFWIATAGNQQRDSFTKGSGNVAIVDPDEWDDANAGANGNTDEFDSTLKTPLIDLTAIGGGQPAGSEASVLKVPAFARDEALVLKPTLGEGQIDSYSMVFDILLTETNKTYTALFQTDVTNSGDAEIYLRNDGDTASIGISGQYSGALSYGQWGRLALVFDTDAAGKQTLSKYLDGTFIGSQVVDGDVSDGSRWSISGKDGVLLFAEPNGFTSDIYANALYFTQDTLDAATIAAMGAADADGPVTAPVGSNDVQFSFDGSLNAKDFGTGTISAITLAGADRSTYQVKGSIFGNPNGTGEAALYQQSNGDDELLLWGDGATWQNYSFDMSFEPADNDTVGAVFYYKDAQNHYKLTMDQENDLRVLTKVSNGVETELARETASYRHFAMQDLRIAVQDGKITITLDDEILFDGPVTDATPLTGGTIGIYSKSMDRVQYDNVSVNPIQLAARALTPDPQDRWVTDMDGDGTATVQMTAAASLSAAGIASYEWLVDGAVVATGQTAALDLKPGQTPVVLRVTDANGAVSRDQKTVTVTDHRAILAADSFDDGDFAGWTIVDEGTQDGPSNWQVVDGALVQTTNIMSAQQGTGSASYSAGGDGPYILRDGTYALWDGEGSKAWTNYAVEATITPNDDDGIGLLFRYVDAQNYYKLESDAQTGLVMLTRHLEGRETILARGYSEYTPGEAQHWRIEARDGVLTPYIDGKKVFGTQIEDRSLPAGTVGLYGWGSENLTFDDVLVTQLDYEPTLNPVTGTDGSDRLAGTAGDDLITSGAGRMDVITGMGGADVFDFSATTTNGVRETRRITDFADDDRLMLGDGVEITRVREVHDNTYLFLNEDRDVIILDGVTAFNMDFLA